ncbi:MAG: phytanoyl-CoA dioxygenase [Planctomycetaceae bacterium]|nr:phytanoyl-CoA dioxygenase [Planctomycetaceae bacterium]
MIASDAREQLDELGYVVLEHFIDPELLNGLKSRIKELFEIEGDQAGAEFRQEEGSGRLANLVNKGDVFLETFGDPRLLDHVRVVLGDRFKLSSLNARNVNPRWDQPQPLHADMGAIPDDSGYWVCNSVWMLDDFTKSNGPIRIIPGTHKLGKLPQDELDDLLASHPDEVLLTGKAGTVVVMNAHAWHGGLPNQTDKSRLAMHAFYARYDKPQQQYQKELLDQELQDSLSGDLRELLTLDDPLNDQVSRNPETRSGFL